MDDKDNSPFVVPYSDRTCTPKRCDPFFIREWETMLVSALIVASVIYIMCVCGHEAFTSNNYVFDRRSSRQAHFTIDDRVGHSNFRASKTPVIKVKGVVEKGKQYPSMGPSVSKFRDFEAVDAIDGIANGEPLPSHTPETSDDQLEQLVRD